MSGVLLSSLVWLSSSAWAQDRFQVVLFPTPTSPEQNITCTANINSDSTSTDQLRLKCQGLMPGSSYTLFLGQSATPGAIPASFVGQFLAGPDGKGKLQAELEIVNAFIGVNPMLDAADGMADGIANVAGAGAIAAKASTVSLDFLRIYRATPMGVPTVFGIAPDQNGGVLVATSTRIPDARAQLATPAPAAAATPAPAPAPAAAPNGAKQSGNKDDGDKNDAKKQQAAATAALSAAVQALPASVSAAVNAQVSAKAPSK